MKVLRRKLWLGMMLCLLMTLSCIENARADFVLKPSGQNAIPLRRKALDVDVTLRGGIASSVETMTFANETSERTEADFILTVPDGAVVTGFAYWYGTEKVVARVVEKERAALIYKHITDRMRDPALVEMVGKNTFRARIFPVMPNADLKVEVRMVQPISSTRNGLLWSLPLKPQQAGTGVLDALDVRVKIEGENDAKKIGNNYGMVAQSENGVQTLNFSRRNYQPDRDLNVALLQAPRSLSSSVYAARSAGSDGFFVVRLSSRETLLRPKVFVKGALYDVVFEKMRVWKAGENWIVCGRYRGTGSAQMTVAGLSAKGAKRRWSLLIALSSRRENNNAATRLWAWARINELSASAKNRARVVALSTRYTLPSKYTSWLAIPEAERQRYKAEKARADFDMVARQAVSVLQAENLNSPRVRQLRARFNRAALALGLGAETEWKTQMGLALLPLQERLDAQNRRSPRSRTARLLRRRIASLKNAGAINLRDREANAVEEIAVGSVEDVVDVEEKLLRARRALQAETEKDRASRRRTRALKSQIAQLSNRYEKLARASAPRDRWAIRGGWDFRAGDPLIAVKAPADTSQVSALLPGGVIKKLLFNAQSGKWEARFDIPTYAMEGEYAIQIVVVRKNGARLSWILRYRVDATPSQGRGALRTVQSGATRAWRLELQGQNDTARVSALLPWGEKVELKPSSVHANLFFALVTPPESAMSSQKIANFSVTYILTDSAHNRASIEVQGTK